MSRSIRKINGSFDNLTIENNMKGPGNIKWVGESQSIQSVIDSCQSPAEDNPFEVIMPPGRKSEDYTRRAHVSMLTLPVRKAMRGSILVVGDNLSNEMKETADFVCDGTADQVELNEAIVAATPGLADASDALPVIMRGQFNTNAPIALKPRLTLDGGNLRGGTRITLANNSDCNIMEFNEPGYGNASFITLKDFIVEGNEANQASGNGIEFITDPMDVFMSRIWVTDAKEDGILSPFGWGNFYHNIIIEFCGGIGLNIDRQVNLSNSKIIDNLGGSIRITGEYNRITGNLLGSCAADISTVLLTADSLSNIVALNTFQANAGSGQKAIHVQGGQNLIIGNMARDGVYDYQIKVENDALHNVVVGNFAMNANTENIAGATIQNTVSANKNQPLMPVRRSISADYTLEGENYGHPAIFTIISNGNYNVNPDSAFILYSQIEVHNVNDCVLHFNSTGTNIEIPPYGTMKAFKSSATEWTLISIEGRKTTAASTGAGTVKMGSGSAADSAGFIEIQPGKFVPYFSDATPT